jgi:hypothetical protein
MAVWFNAAAEIAIPSKHEGFNNKDGLDGRPGRFLYGYHS